MNTKEDLVIISNERIINKNDNFYCSNIDIKSIAEGLNDHFNVMLLSRKSKNIRMKLNECTFDFELGPSWES